MVIQALNGCLTNYEKKGFFVRRYEQKRFEFQTFKGETITIAALDRLNGSPITALSASNLSFWKRLFWVPVRIRTEDGVDKYILIRKSSCLKQLKGTGLSSSAIYEGLRNSNLNHLIQDSFKAKIKSQLVKHKVANPDAIIEQLFTINAFGNDLEFGRFMHNPGENKYRHNLPGFIGQIVVEFDAATKKRIIKLDRGLNVIELCSYKDEQYFLISTIKKITGVVTPGITLSHQEKLQTITTLRNLKFAPYKDGKLLTPLRIQYPCELKKSATALARTILFDQNGELLIVASRKRGDGILGEGTFKKVKRIYAVSGEKFAAFNVKNPHDAMINKERHLRARFRLCQGVLQSKGQIGSKIIDEMYTSDIFNARMLSFEQKFEMLPDIFKGLLAFHNKGYIHRDIKPENIFYRLKADGHVEAAIADFGLAVVKQSEEARRIGGTRDFMPPEYPREDNTFASIQRKDVTKESFDIYSLGITLEELFSDYIQKQNGPAPTRPIPRGFEQKARQLQSLIYIMKRDDSFSRATWPVICECLEQMGVFI